MDDKMKVSDVEEVINGNKTFTKEQRQTAIDDLVDVVIDYLNRTDLPEDRDSARFVLINENDGLAFVSDISLAKKWKMWYDVFDSPETYELRKLLGQVKATDSESKVRTALKKKVQERLVTIKGVHNECDCGKEKHNFTQHSHWCTLLK